MDHFAQLLINGISLGSIIALGAVGLTLTYGILRLSNFAHGDYMTLGAYLTFVINASGVNVWLAMLLSALFMVVYALAAEFILWRPMRQKRATDTTLIILSLGLALFMRNAIILVWGAGNQRYNLPVAEALAFGSLRVPLFNLVVIGMAGAAMAGLHYLLQNTKIGKAMRAVADDIDLARVTGINVDRVVLWTWVIAAGLTALAGSMLGLVEAVRPNMGWFLILPLFAAVVLGGIGNPYGAIAGGLMIGIAQEVGTGMGDFLSPLANHPQLGQVVGLISHVFSSQYKAGIALVIMMLVLLVKPQGLFKGTM
jgi:neutral amino acid transport system permease protein